MHRRRYAMTVAMPSGSTAIGTAIPSSTTVTGQFDIAWTVHFNLKEMLLLDRFIFAY
jgi:hypothetical protein